MLSRGRATQGHPISQHCSTRVDYVGDSWAIPGGFAQQQQRRANFFLLLWQKDKKRPTAGIGGSRAKGASGAHCARLKPQDGANMDPPRTRPGPGPRPGGCRFWTFMLARPPRRIISSVPLSRSRVSLLHHTLSSLCTTGRNIYPPNVPRFTLLQYSDIRTCPLRDGE